MNAPALTFRWRPVIAKRCLLLALLIASCALRAQGAEPIQVHPENPKYFLFRGKPLVLISASEHYGSVINRPFDYRKYLDDAADKRMTMTRTFLLYRELQTPRNPWSPCKPESPDYIAPWPRTGPGKALDGEPIYDLDRWNGEYFTRLRSFLEAASRRGIVVELTLFSHAYREYLWALNPLRAENNKQGVGKVPWQAYDSLTEPALVERQKAYVRKVVAETCRFDNVYYEVCNEPAGSVAGSTVSTADVDAWLKAMAAEVRAELARQGCHHLVFGAEAFEVAKLSQNFEDSLAGKTWDAIIVHPHSYLHYRNRNYRLGDFMSKTLALRELRDFCLDMAGERKPIVLDEDNTASMYRDPVGWTIHRKRAWATVLSGAHYDFIDFSITVGQEAGTTASSLALRTWYRHLSELIHSFDFIHARPGANWLRHVPSPLVACTMAVPDKDYLAYLADARESKAGPTTPVSGEVELHLPAGRFEVRLFSPTMGSYSPSIYVDGGAPRRLMLLPFEHDVVVRATRTTAP